MRIYLSYCNLSLLILIIFCLDAHAQSVSVRHDYVPFNEASYEIPALKKSDKVIVYEGFTLSYNPKTLLPNWVAYELTSSEVDGTYPRVSGFSMDLDYKGRQAMREDYSSTGWDKGHMAPAADMKWSRTAMYESFFLTNICPQDHELNGNDWLTLEKLGREWAKRFGSVYIVCGPIVGNNYYGTIGDNKVVVPDAFFKAFLVVEEHRYHAIAFVMQNESKHHRIQEYAMTVNELEDLIGLDLFSNIDDSIEEMIESDLYFRYWSL